MSKPKGYILYSGPSLLDGSPIVAIATMSTSNRKTGKMVQTWIIRSDIDPVTASRSGADVSVCGDCMHRPSNNGACYVTLFQAPLAVYRGYHRGIYSNDLSEFYARLAGRKLRIGAYGDGAAVPETVWREAISHSAGHTGYTHQWQRPGFADSYLDFLMASIDTPEQARLTTARYFRVKLVDEPALPREVECLADSVGKACADCLLCDGGTKGKSVYINVHGAKESNYIIARAA